VTGGDRCQIENANAVLLKHGDAATLAEVFRAIGET
jgi:hypothetical protein